MNKQKMREEFEAWRDESPNQRYGSQVWDAWQAACASRQLEIDHWKTWNLKSIGDSEMTERIDHDQAFKDSCAREMAFGVDSEQMNEYINHTLNAVDNLDDMPISEHWAKKWVAKAIELLERNNYFRGLPLDTREEKPPVEPEDVYSPHAVIIDDKCRKCAGQMRTGKAIEQAFTGSPDFVGGSIVTMFNGG